MLVSLALLVLSFTALIYGANYFVKGASSIAYRLGVSAFVIGLTVVSIGTSSPELFVNVVAALQGATDISIGNILGSNLAGILLGLGIAAIIVPLRVKHSTVWKEIPFALLAMLMILVFGSDMYLDGGVANIVTRTDGIALLALFLIFIVYTFGLATVRGQAAEQVEQYPWPRTLLYTLGGLVALTAGGKFAVDAGVDLASSFGVSQNLIGLTIIAAGTSLPEIVTAGVAAYQRHMDLVVGGIVGTIIFNALFALGITALVRPIPFGVDSVVDALVALVATVLLFFLMFVGRKRVLTRNEGIFFVVFYVTYIVFVIWRG